MDSGVAKYLNTLKSIAAVFAAALFLLWSGQLWAFDLDADDYSAGAIPAGTNLGLVYLQHVQRDKVNADGHKVSDGDLTSDVAILRYARFVDVLGMRADPQFLLPVGRLRGTGALDGLGKGSGLGDLVLAATVWLHNKPEDGEFFGVTPFITLPTGGYDRNRALNLGENRWKFTLQTAYVTPVVTNNLSLQLSGDVTFYTPNNDYGAAGQRLTQQPQAQFQAWLRYNFTPDLDFRVGASQFVGGRTSVDGIANRDRVTTTNFKVGAGWNFAPGWNLVGLYGRDLRVENGLVEANRVNLRILRAF